MELNDMMIGFLDWKPLTGYELKGMFTALDFLPWSGNNNQIYKALIELEKDGYVTKEVIPQENHPPQKRYSVTEKGRLRLKESLHAECEAPFVRNEFLLRLAWSNILSEKETLDMILDYQECIGTELKACREKIRRKAVRAERNPREAYIWEMIERNREMALECELNWAVRLLNGLANKGGA